MTIFLKRTTSALACVRSRARLRSDISRTSARAIAAHRQQLSFVSSSTPWTDSEQTRRVSSSAHPSTLSSSSSTRLFSSATPSSSSSSSSDEDPTASDFFAASHESFESMGVTSPILLSRLNNLNLSRPSAVQAAAYQAISKGGDVTIGAETGSGKTYAYLLPILDDILQRKQQSRDELSYDYCRALILVPNKELVQQVVRMALALCADTEEESAQALVSQGGARGGMFQQDTENNNNIDESSIIRLAVMPGGLNEPMDFAPFRFARALGGSDPPVDIVVSTPAAVGPLGLKPKNIDMFADIETLVIDEADMLLDGGYIRSLENALLGFRRADKLDSSLGVKKTQHVFVAATLPDMGLRSVDAYLQKKFPRATRVTMAGMHNARHYGLQERTVWIEEDKDGNRGRMMSLVELLQTSREEGGLEGEKVMVFLNSVDDVDGAAAALGRAGFPAVPYHAKIPLAERSSNLDRFRRYHADTQDEDPEAVPILVCTDLASRGLDVPGVTVVVQLQFAGNVVAHLHRMGRCGRAGKRDGRGIIFYGAKERDLVEVVREAEHQQDRMVLQQDVDEIDEDDPDAAPLGSVKGAFSRKRGFRKKRKKERQEAVSRDDQ